VPPHALRPSQQAVVLQDRAPLLSIQDDPLRIQGTLRLPQAAGRQTWSMTEACGNPTCG